MSGIVDNRETDPPMQRRRTGTSERCGFPERWFGTPGFFGLEEKKRHDD